MKSISGGVSGQGRVCVRRGGARALGWSALVLSTLLVERGVAQEGRLSVAPQAIKGPEQTAQDGEFPIDSLGGYWAYVPPACVGGPRCPLLVVTSDIPANGLPQTMLGWQRPVAEKYGMIVLVQDPYLPPSFTQPDSVQYAQPSGGDDLSADTKRLNAALTQVLQKFAVDRDRIALLGSLAFDLGVPQALSNAWPWGLQNPDVFSRVIISAQLVPPDLTLPVARQTKPTEFLLTAGFREEAAAIAAAFQTANQLRQQGYPAKTLLSIKAQGRGIWEEFDAIGRWLHDSWAAPRPALATSASVGDSLPLLTPEAVTQLGRFWASFETEPDSIRRLGRRAHLREVVLPIGKGAERPFTVMVDMSALAAQYPSVAAKLRAAGLTAEQHDAYRLALLSAQAGSALGASTAGPASALAQNIAFLQAHPRDQSTGFVAAGTRLEGATLLETGGLYLRSFTPPWVVGGMWQTP